MKRCSKCGSLGEQEDFSRDKRAKDGLHSSCRTCQRATNTAWRHANRDKQREATRQWNLRNPERVKAMGRQRYLDQMATDPDRRRAQRLAWTKTSQGRLYNRVATYRRRNARGITKESREYVSVLLSDPCSYCNGPGGEVDHITPLSKSGTGGLDNLTAACRSCNARKNDQDLLAFLTRKVA